MKAFIILLCFVGLVYCAEKYSNKYDDFDVDTLIGNERLLKAYINCFLDKGRCTPEGSEFKKALPDAVKTNCGKCTEKQKENVRKVARAIKKHHAKQWDDLVRKVDQTGKHGAAFEKFVHEES